MSIFRALMLPLASITFLLLWWWATQAGPRGSDQFWYAGYVEQFILRGRPSTNYVTASAWLAAFPPPPVHHIPALYPALLLGCLGLTSFAAWTVTNLALVFTGLAFLFMAVRRVSGMAGVVVSVALFLPITFWITANPLAEASLYCFGGMVAYGFALRRTGAEHWGSAWIIAGMALQSLTRPNHTLMLAAMIAYLIFFDARQSRRWMIVLLGGLAIGLVALRGTLLPQYPMGGITSLLMMGAPGVPGINMLPFLASHEVSFDLTAFVAKALNSAAIACPTSSYDLMMVGPVLIMLIAIFIRLSRTRSESRRDQWAYLILSITTLATTAIIYQYQPRYWSAFILPIVFFASDGITVNRGALKAVYSVLLVAGLAMVVMADRIRRDGSLAVNQCDNIRRYFEAHAPDGGAVLVLNDIDQRWSYALPKSAILVSSTDLQTPEEIAIAIRDFDVKLVVAPTDSANVASIAEQFDMTRLPVLVFGDASKSDYLAWRPRGSPVTPSVH